MKPPPMTPEQCAEMRKQLGLRPECPQCKHSNWTYQKSIWSWACHIHGWLPRGS